MSIDMLTLGVGFVSFGLFLLFHFMAFRRLGPEGLLKTLFSMVIAFAWLPAVLMGVLFIYKPSGLSPQAWVCATALAVLVQGLLCFVYVLCVFGPYETSVRMRLVREIARAGREGISPQDLARRYNHETIVGIRLRRLVGAGDIIKQDDGLYRAGNTRNLFFLFDAIAIVIKKWIGR